MQESQHIEFKRQWKDDLLKWVCAFANSDGGVLMLGYNDRGEAGGLENIEKLLEDIPDKLMLWNPGQLSESWTLEKLMSKHESIPYNPEIARCFFSAGLIEAWGRGIERIIEACKQDDYPLPVWKVEPNGMWVMFEFEVDPATQKTTCEQIFELLQHDSKMTRDDLAQAIGVSADAIKQHLANLQKDNLLKREGGRKEGWWRVVR